jgi:hypothetical protein
MIKVLMISRATLFSSPGGDTVQVEETANYLRKIDVVADIKLSNEEINFNGYDLVHFFNIIIPNDRYNTVAIDIVRSVINERL